MTSWWDWNKEIVITGAIFTAAIGGLVAVAYYASQPSSEPITAADGKPAFLVKCNSPGDCPKEAARVCPQGYTVITSASERGTSTTYINQGNGVMVPVTSDTYDGAMVIRCRGQL